jgi:hypothetical protein
MGCNAQIFVFLLTSKGCYIQELFIQQKEIVASLYKSSVAPDK